ncbi:MAG: UTP--glucose-1-phosphate uridylyltransferase [Oscillospiraceae bacterium]|nr:UTP--glucose-1-phosphate uridylyltransferase [Oscillospiraceae bacterium]
MKKITKAVIPAAGLGTRVLPASKAVPKEMLNIVDKPAIQYLVEEAAASGITDILIITNRGKGIIEDHFDYAFELETGLKGKAGKEKYYEAVRSVADLANIYYIRQKETKGLGHAILAAEAFMAGEPFAVLYGDDIIISEDPVTAQLCRAFEKFGKMAVGVNECSREAIKKYCSLDVTPLEGRVMNCHKIIEKPTESEIMSLYAILGRNVLTSEIFDLIRATPVSEKGGEVYLTDALSNLAEHDKLTAVDFTGNRYDMGDKLGIMQANCEVALNHPEIGTDFKDYIIKLAESVK